MTVSSAGRWFCLWWSRSDRPRPPAAPRLAQERTRPLRSAGPLPLPSAGAGRRPRLRNAHYEPRAPALVGRLEGHAAAVGLGDGLDDRQSEAEGAATITRAADEAFEQARDQVGGDPGPVVLNNQRRLAIGGAGPNADLRARRRVAQGVLQQVDRKSVELITRRIHDGRVHVEDDVVVTADGSELGRRLDGDLGDVPRLAPDYAPDLPDREEQQV